MNRPLTQEQAVFAAEHHDLIFAYLRYKRYPVDEFYDIAVFGYLRAVRVYHEREDLRAYAFSTIAYQAMRSAISTHFRSQNCPMRRAEVYPYNEDEDMPLYSDTAGSEPERNLTAKGMEEKLLHVLTPQQNQVVYMKADGYSTREIGERLNMKTGQVSREIRAAGAAIRELAPELLCLAA